MLNIPIEVQDALREGALRKNYKMKVNDIDPDTGERTYLYTIDNDTLVSESVKIDERMVTGKVLKFGLCEGSSLEFQYFDHPNINGKDVQVYCSVEYVDGNGDVDWYDIPMGWYTVDQCPMQWDTGIYKVTAYNKLKSKYLDAKANQTVEELVAQGEYLVADEMSLYSLLKNLLGDYGIYEKATESIPVSYIVNPTAVTPALNFGIPLYTSAGIPKNTNLYVYSALLTISLNEDDFYNFYLYTEEIYENARDNVWNQYKDERTVKNGTSYTIEEFATTVSDSRATTLRGEISATKSNNVQLFRRLGNNPDIQTDDYSRIVTVSIYIPVITIESSSEPPIPSGSAVVAAFEQKWGYDFDFVDINHLLLSDADKIRLTTSEILNVSDITLRELQSAVYETMCQYGQLDRETDLFTGVELNQGGLYPADTLYPDNALYPQGTMEHPFPSTYSKLWTDTVGEQSFRYLIITYKAMENGQEVDKTLQRTVNADGTTNYNMSDNWLFRNLVWTAADVGDYADAMVLKMKDIRWFPFEMWCAGLPYVETGDAIEITDKQGNTHTSYVLTRTLDGIHNLQDTFINGELDIF